MNNKLRIAFLLFLAPLFCASLLSQIRVSGFVQDGKTHERLIGANVLVNNSLKGTATDNRGYFSLTAEKSDSLSFSFTGYKRNKICITSFVDTVILVDLFPGDYLKEITVAATQHRQSNMVSLNALEISSIPALGGKPDVMKAMQLLPGIQTTAEGSGMLLVRGGDPGQNLYLFDGVPITYVHHLGGFMSVFNPDMINTIDIYKGNFPAKFGGKLSSVIDITQREGDISGFNGSWSIGLTDLSFSLEGPVKKIKNSSYLITGRKTLTDPLMALLTGASGGNDFILSYGFHDINGKFSWKPNANNSLHFNIYQGDDYMNYWNKRKSSSDPKNRISITWGNWLASARWNSVFASGLSGTSSLAFTNYRLSDKQVSKYDNAAVMDDYEKRYKTTVKNTMLISDWNKSIIEHWNLNFGIQTSAQYYMPNSIYKKEETVFSKKEELRVYENAAYLNNKINLFRHLNLNLGLRMVNFSGKGFSYNSLEPRLELDARINANHHFNLSYSKVQQNSHLLFTSGKIMSNEVWVASNKEIKPASSGQYSAGLISSFLNHQISTELNVYYKTMTDLSTYREGYSNLAGDINWRTKIESGGKGTSKGVEFLLRKPKGKITGFASYAWSHTDRRYSGINNGQTFLFDYDRPHSISISLAYALSEKWIVSSSWVYQSGLPYTPVIGHQLVPQIENYNTNRNSYYDALIYGERNSMRMKDYHRMDVSFSYTTRTKRRNNKAVWTFSVYNAYNRLNPYHYYYNDNASSEITQPEFHENLGELKLYQLAFFPIIPSVSYKVYFDGNIFKRKQKTEKKSKIHNWLYYDKK